MLEQHEQGERDYQFEPTEPESIVTPYWDIDDREEVDGEGERRPKYERKSFYPATHTIKRILNRHRGELGRNEDQPELDKSKVDEALLNLTFLADQYLTSPQNTTASEQQKRIIGEFEQLGDKSGDLLADAFLDQLREEKARVAKSTDEETTPDSDIESDIVKILSHKQVRDEFEKMYEQETSLRRSAKKPISEIIELRGAVENARAKYRQAQNAPTKIDAESAPLPTGIINRNLEKYLEIIDTLKERIKTKEAGLSYRERGLVESARLLKTKRELREFGFALTESRQELFDRISELVSGGYKVFLGGPTGTGKTSLAIFAMRQSLENESDFEVVSWSPETTTRDLFGKPIIKTNTEGKIESAMQKGPYARVLSGETRGIVNDEYTSGQTASQLSLKRIYQARPGEDINLPGFNGQVFTKENYLEISTGNLKSKQHQQREEMDPAVAREHVAIAVPFMSSEEAREVLLASYIHETGYLPLSRRSVEMIDQLCRVAEFTQKAFEGKFDDDDRISELYKKVEPSGAEIHLTKTFFDSGTLFRLVGGISGKSFTEHLKTNLEREINDNPHLDALPQEKEAFKKILKVFGFDVDATKEEDFYKPVEAENHIGREFNKLFILPSEMGFLANIEKSDDDEFGDLGEDSGENGFKDRVQGEIDDLLANPNIPASVKEALARKESSPETIEINEAREIMDANLTEEEKKDGITNFLGPDEIKKTTFGPESVPSEIPPIPFSKEELLQAAKLGQFLILRSDQISKDKLQLPNVKKALEKAPEKRWALVTKEIIPNSTDKNYLEQIEQTIIYLKNQVFEGRKLPIEYQSAIAEFENKKEELRPKVTSQDEAVWKSAVEELINLDIVKMTRRTLDEVYYDLELYKQATGQYLLPNIYDWTRTRASDGGLVDVGAFDSDGVLGRRSGPGSSPSRLGAFFSRSI